MSEPKSTAVLVRGLEADEYEKLKTRAKKNGRAIGREAMIIIREKLSETVVEITSSTAGT